MAIRTLILSLIVTLTGSACQATISQPGGRSIDGMIESSTPDRLVVRTNRGVESLRSDQVEEIDHPGNGLLFTGLGIGLFGIVVPPLALVGGITSIAGLITWVGSQTAAASFEPRAEPRGEDALVTAATSSRKDTTSESVASARQRRGPERPTAPPRSCWVRRPLFFLDANDIVRIAAQSGWIRESVDTLDEPGDGVRIVLRARRGRVATITLTSSETSEDVSVAQFQDGSVSLAVDIAGEPDAAQRLLYEIAGCR